MQSDELPGQVQADWVDELQERLVVACTQETMAEAVALREKGLTYQQVADKIGYTKLTMRRYMSLHSKYGPDAFITAEELKKEPNKARVSCKKEP
mgnify:CR=1 FL=1